MTSTGTLWTGRLELELLDHFENTVGMLEFSIRLDILTVWWGNRTLSVVDRRLFRGWLRQQSGRSLHVDDLTWSIDAGCLALSIDNQPNYLLPDEFVTRLAEVI